jgi:DNA-binding NarL/FixJ family response regulator
VRTVEHHVASLFTRTGVNDRASLAEFAALSNGGGEPLLAP